MSISVSAHQSHATCKLWTKFTKLFLLLFYKLLRAKFKLGKLIKAIAPDIYTLSNNFGKNVNGTKLLKSDLFLMYRVLFLGIVFSEIKA